MAKPAEKTADTMARRKVRYGEFAIEGWMLMCAMVSILTTAGILIVLLSQSWLFFRADEVSVFEFLTGTKWQPLLSDQKFGILPLIGGTLMITVIAGLLALPLGLAIAIYLSEYAGPLQKKIVRPFLEVLAGIPTIVYGYFALTFITPILQSVVPETNIFNAASAGIVVGIMILPMVASLSEDALRSVPGSLRHGAYAMGASSWQTSLTVVVPAALSGISSAFILALSRAVGETMAVTIAAGSTPNLTMNPLESIQTMTAYIVQVAKGDVDYGSVKYYSLFAVALVLFAFTFSMNVVANRIQKRFREVYEG